jgi:hypothetical protein
MGFFFSGCRAGAASDRVVPLGGVRVALKYKNLAVSEVGIGQEVLGWLLDDDEIMSVVMDFHDRGKRCAVVVWLAEDEIDDAYISDDTALKDEFELKKVRDAVDLYDPQKSMCVVIVRDDKAAVLLGDLD